uniref:Cytochrome b-c1 complex subunit 7 n=1 Tax=Amphora coffeiformis TaxID=265554 RepID=A0A7S3L3S0_9STRA|mmetsp:Transcript_9647/g.18425  ORF Transcript_9647/g.18425 Transcript_9647/m.18425 type:complete len:115 (+) Transcript_9647:51-395(+)|eukprot:scaffold521_cov167-Amphora_coffeaeformis.AAC.8
MATQMFSKGFMNWAAKAYQKSLAGELNKMGLRWEDLIISARAPVTEAMELADPDVMKGRMRRLKRASDLSYKGKVLTDYVDVAKLEPFKFELWDDVKKLQARDEEYAIMNLHKK